MNTSQLTVDSPKPAGSAVFHLESSKFDLKSLPNVETCG